MSGEIIMGDDLYEHRFNIVNSFRSVRVGWAILRHKDKYLKVEVESRYLLRSNAVFFDLIEEFPAYAQEFIVDCPESHLNIYLSNSLIPFNCEKVVLNEQVREIDTITTFPNYKLPESLDELPMSLGNIICRPNYLTEKQQAELVNHPNLTLTIDCR